MFSNFLKIAFRNIFRNKVYAAINIAGLAMGIAAFLLLAEYISLEKSVNQFHKNLPGMYRLINEDAAGKTWPEQEPGWALQAKQRFPELKYYGLKTHRLNRGLKVHLVASPFFNFVYYASFKKVCRS
jgi:putative ABC transport system permease protein